MLPSEQLYLSIRAHNVTTHSSQYDCSLSYYCQNLLHTLHNSNTMFCCNKTIICNSNRESRTMKVDKTSVHFYSFPLSFKQSCACYFEEYGHTNVYSTGTFMPHHHATDLLSGSNTCVFNLQPARLYHVACGPFCKLCIYYNNYTKIYVVRYTTYCCFSVCSWQTSPQ